MSITENIFAKIRLQETSSFICRSATTAAFVSLLAVAPVITPQKSNDYIVVKIPDSSQSSITTYGIDTERKSYKPRTPLGEKLIALRKKAIAKGMLLMDAGEISEEISRRR